MPDESAAGQGVMHGRPVGTRIPDPETDSDATCDSGADRQLAEHQADRARKRVHSRARMRAPTGIWRRRTALHATHIRDLPPLQSCIRCNGCAVRRGYKTCDDCRLRRDCRVCLRRGIVSNEWGRCRNMCLECCRRWLSALEPEPQGLWDLSFRGTAAECEVSVAHAITPCHSEGFGPPPDPGEG
jgi:hypothetical protein